MIYEFAVDPEALNNWERFRYVIEKFGIEKGRLISRFPKRWERVLLNNFTGTVIQKKSVEERLINIKSKYLISGRSYDTNINWLENALNKNLENNFKAILALCVRADTPQLLNIDDLDETNEYFKIETGLKVKRKAKELSEVVIPLLEASRRITFVDPNFDPNSRFINVFIYLMNSLKSTEIISIEYHLKKDYDFVLFKKNCESKLKKLIPKSRKIKFVRWENSDLIEKMHPRYVFTERGGIRIDYGLDEGQGEETTDVQLLNDNLYDERFKQYLKETSPFRFADELEIEGTKETT